MKNALASLFNNMLLWGIFTCLFTFILTKENNLTVFDPIPSQELYKLINLKVFGLLLLSVAAVFIIYSYLTHIAKNIEETVKGKWLVNFSLAECSSILYSFGSLNFAILMFISDLSLLVATITSYILGITLYPKTSYRI